MSDEKAALASARGAWNPFRALFNPAIVDVAAVPKLKPVYDVLKAMADVAIAGAPAISKAIVDAGGLDPDPPLTALESEQARLLSDALTKALQVFENNTTRQVFAVLVERASDGKVQAGDVTLLR